MRHCAGEMKLPFSFTNPFHRQFSSTNRSGCSVCSALYRASATVEVEPWMPSSPTLSFVANAGRYFSLTQNLLTKPRSVATLRSMFEICAGKVAPETAERIHTAARRPASAVCASPGSCDKLKKLSISPLDSSTTTGSPLMALRSSVGKSFGS